MIRRVLYFIFSFLIFVNGQLPLLKKDDGKPPPNPFGDTDPTQVTTGLANKPTPPPLDLGSHGQNNQASTLLNPPTPPPLPTPPPIGAPGAGPSNNQQISTASPTPSTSNPNNPFDKIPSKNSNGNGDPHATFNAIKTKKPPGGWKNTRSQDDGHSNGQVLSDPSNRINGPGWPRVPKSLLVRNVNDQDTLRRFHQRRRRQNIGQAMTAGAGQGAVQNAGNAVAAAKAANTASQLTGGGLPGTGLGQSGLPGSGLPNLGNGLPNVPGKSGLPSLPGNGLSNAGNGLPKLPGKGGLPNTGNGLPNLPGQNGGLSNLPGKGGLPKANNGLPNLPGQNGTDPNKTLPAAKAANKTGKMMKSGDALGKKASPNRPHKNSRPDIGKGNASPPHGVSDPNLPPICIFPDSKCQLVLPPANEPLPKMILPRHKQILDANPHASGKE